MNTYTITSQHGTYCLMLGTLLIAQSSDLEALERVQAGLEHRHPDRKQP